MPFIPLQEVPDPVLEKKGGELFKELYRLYSTASVEDYFRNGRWNNDLMKNDYQMIAAHRKEAGAPKPPGVEEIDCGELPEEITPQTNSQNYGQGYGQMGPGGPMGCGGQMGPGGGMGPGGPMGFGGGMGVRPGGPMGPGNFDGGAGDGGWDGADGWHGGGGKGFGGPVMPGMQGPPSMQQPPFPGPPSGPPPRPAGPPPAQAKAPAANTAVAGGAVAELRLIALFVAKWKLDPGAAKKALAGITPQRRRFVIQNFKTTVTGAEATAALTQYLDECEMSGIWDNATGPMAALAAGQQTKAMPPVIRPPVVPAKVGPVVVSGVAAPKRQALDGPYGGGPYGSPPPGAAPKPGLGSAPKAQIVDLAGAAPKGKGSLVGALLQTF